MPNDDVASSPRVVLLRIACILYVLGLLAWTTYAVLWPQWVGRSYHRVGTNEWRATGTFGLDTYSAPLWSPPKAGGEGMTSTVRMPGSPVTEANHVEVVLWGIVTTAVFAVIVLGIALRIAARILVPGRRDRFVHYAWCLALGEGIAMLALVVIGALSMGYALIPEVVISALSGGALLGTGVALFWRPRVQPATAGAPPLTRSAAEAQAAEQLAQPPSFSFGWCALGVVVAVGIGAIAWSVASTMRGPASGVSELGTTLYSQPQEPINQGAGAAIVIAGVVTGCLVLRLIRARRPARAFAVGVIAASVLLGATIAFAK